MELAFGVFGVILVAVTWRGITEDLRPAPQVKPREVAVGDCLRWRHPEGGWEVWTVAAREGGSLWIFRVFDGSVAELRLGAGEWAALATLPGVQVWEVGDA